MKLRAAVREALAAHGIKPQGEEGPESLRERLNGLYLEEVRGLRERQRKGEIPLPEYAGHVEALKRRFALLGLPLGAWLE